MRERSRRAERLSDLIKEELGNLLEYEVREPRIGFATLTEVHLSPDLKTADVYVTVPGDRKQKEESLRGLLRAQGFLRHELGQRLGLRHVPVLTFHLDWTEQSEQRMDELLRRARSGD